LPAFAISLSRALSQFDDPVFLGVLWRCVLWSVACFAGLHVAALWLVHHLLDLHGWMAWLLDILGSVAASLLAMWLFLPLSAAIGTLYFDRIAAAVEHRWYPYLPPPFGAPLAVQVWDSVMLALRILLLNVLALLLAIFIPGIGLVLGWAIAAYALGRGLFVAVAMRRMPRDAARDLYHHRRGMVWALGAVLAFGAYVPLLNLLLPIIGVAAMVHLLDQALAR